MTLVISVSSVTNLHKFGLINLKDYCEKIGCKGDVKPCREIVFIFNSNVERRFFSIARAFLNDYAFKFFDLEVPVLPYNHIHDADFFRVT